MYCQQCGSKLDDNAKICSKCNAPVIRMSDVNNISNEAESSQTSSQQDTQLNNEQLNNQQDNAQPDGSSPKKLKKSTKIVIVICSAVAAAAVVLLLIWYFSAGYLIGKANQSIENNDFDAAQSYLSYACPFGKNIDDVNQLSQNITDSTALINTVIDAQAENDIITALNSSKQAYNLLPNCKMTEEYFNVSNQNFYNWLLELYNGGKYSEAAHAFSQLTEEVSTDETNEMLSHLREMFKTKADEFLTSAQSYYNNYEPDKAAENTEIVIMLDNQNADALALQEKIDTYNTNKVNIDDAQSYYNNKDYTNALASFDKADDYTKTVHKALREQITTAQNNQKIDNMYGSYVGTYIGAPVNSYGFRLGVETVSITKIENGCIWLNGSLIDDGTDFSYGANSYYSKSGASLANGSVQVYSTCVDSEYGTTYNESRTITLKNGRVYISCSVNGSHSYNVELEHSIA